MLWYLVIIHLKSLNRHCVNKFVIVIHLLTNTARQIPGNIHLVFNRLINLTSIKTGQVRHGPGGCPDNFQRVVGVGGSWPQGLTREELRKRVRERLVREEDGREREGETHLGGGQEGVRERLQRWIEASVRDILCRFKWQGQCKDGRSPWPSPGLVKPLLRCHVVVSYILSNLPHENYQWKHATQYLDLLTSKSTFTLPTLHGE